MAPSLSKNILDTMELLDSGAPSSIILEGANFLANGHPVLTEVPMNIVATPSPFTTADKTKNPVGCFVGFDVDEPKGHHARGAHRQGQWYNVHEHIQIQSLVDHSLGWKQWKGHGARDPDDDLEKNDLGRPYVVLLPIVERPFRASLQPGVDNYVDMCVESGSSQVCGASFRSSLYMHVGDDPYSLVKEALKVVRVHLGTFKLLEEKSPPGIVDKFGWCTWDAFYLDVNPKGVYEGVKCLVEGGCPPGLVLIGDGWQSICHDEDPITNQEGMNRTSAGEQMPCRLTKFEENYKFRNYKSPRLPSKKDMGAFVRDLKEEFKSIQHVYVWHALCGYWGGIRPNVPCMPESRIIAPKLSQCLQMTMEDLAVDKIVDNGIGLVPP